MIVSYIKFVKIFNMAKTYKSKVDKEKCIGCGTCAALAKDTFEMTDENKAKVKDSEHDEDATVLQAAQSCPVAAIEVEDENGGKIYPKD